MVKLNSVLVLKGIYERWFNLLGLARQYDQLIVIHNPNTTCNILLKYLTYNLTGTRFKMFSI